MDHQHLQQLVEKYTNYWNAHSNRASLWVIGAKPGDLLNIPGVVFSRDGQPVAGMHQSVHAELIVLNLMMTPASLASTFFHEYGHARYRVATSPADWNEIDSEAAAIGYCLEALESEGLADLAAREVLAVLDMARAEPYKSAVGKLATHPLWVKYASIAAPEGAKGE